MSDEGTGKRPRKDSAMQQAVEEDLRNTRTFTSKLIEASLNGIFIYDLDEGSSVYVSPRTTRLLGYTVGDFQEMGPEQFFALFHSDDVGAAHEVLVRLQGATDDDVLEMEHRFRKVDGNWLWCLTRISVFDRADQGKVTQVMGTSLDISERKEMEEQLRESEALYRGLVDMSPDIIGAVDMDGLVLFNSPSAVRIQGMRPEEVVGQPFENLVTPDERQRAAEAFGDVMQNGSVDNFRCRMLRADGSATMTETSARLIRDGAGEPREIVYITRDIEDRWKAEERLRYHAGLMASVPDAVFSMDMNRVIQSWNKTAAELYGWTAEEAVGRLARDVLQPVDDKAQDERRAALLEHGGWRGEVINRHRDGRLLTVLASVAVFKDEAGQPAGIVAVSRDITERKQLKAHMAQTDRMASVGLLAAGVAHEINNPLTYVLQNVASLAEDLPHLAHAQQRLQDVVGQGRAQEVLGDQMHLPTPVELEELPRLAAEAVEGARRVRDIVRDLKTFARTEDQALARLNVNDVLLTAASMAANEIRYRARLEQDLADVPDIVANEGKLAQVFLNLLVNAAHAVDEGDTEGNEIRLCTREAGDHVEVVISDTGKGIPAADLPRLFEPFFTTKDVGHGMGLGLSICHNIVSECGGEIDVQSEEGRGTSFIVRLPISARRPTPDVVARPPTWTEDHVDRGRFLIVDDEELVGRAMVRVLNREQDTVLATSGGEARELLSRDRAFHGVLCDLMMPEVTGMDLHEWMVEHTPELARRTMFVTGGAFTPRAQEFLKRVENPVLQKPCQPAELREWARRMVEQL